MVEELPNLNIFMICDRANTEAYSEMPQGFSIRPCRKSELAIWKQMPFDTSEMAEEYLQFMDDYFNLVYAPKGELFFERCLFVVDENDVPVGTGFSWKSYDAVTTMGWYKVIKTFEGKGIGRALLTTVIRSLLDSDYPIILHTQPESDRAIKLYSDFGFKLLTDDFIGRRKNHINECLPLLRATMPKADYESLQFTSAPKSLLEFLEKQTLDEF